MTRACRPLTAWRRAAPFFAAALLAPAVASPDTCSTLAFGTPSSQTTGSAPIAVVAADFNRDGKTDVVTANSAGNSVSLLLGTGTGSGALGPASTLGVGSTPADLVAGDLDRDGFLDLVVATTSDFQLLKGSGTGFSGTSFTPGVTATRVALADFNRDGWPDLVVMNEGANLVRVLAGNGTIGFGGTLGSDLVVTAPAAAVAGDFNRDGMLDLAVVSRGLNQVQVFLGDGTGFLGNGATSPTPFTTVTTGTGPRDVAARDLDRDGKVDLVTADYTAGTVSMLIGAGNGTFTPQLPAVPVGGSPRRVALSDLDRDGLADLVVLDETPPAPALVAFRGKATPPPFFDATRYPAALPGASGPQGLALGDFTSDGHADLVTALSGTSQALVVPNLSGSSCVRTSFAGAPRSYPAGDGPVSSAAADFDEDGRPDLAVATAMDSRIWVLKGTPAGFLASAFSTVSPAPRAVATADLNFDGHADVVAALGDSGSGRVQVFLGSGTGALTPGASRTAGVNTSAIAIGDLDGNGSPDVAAASESDGAVWIFLGDGAGGLTPYAGNPVQTGLLEPRAIVAAELTGDARIDLAVADSGTVGNTVRVLRNMGGGAFSPVATLTVGLHPWGIAAADLDGDGKTDLVTADNGAARVSVLMGLGSGSFASAVPYTVAGSPTAVALLDVTGSASPDIVVTTTVPSLGLLVNDGNGVFTPATGAPLRSSPQSITPIDADADGRMDLAIPCRAADAVVVLLAQAGSPAFPSALRIAVGAQPRAVVTVDLDGDGRLDLAVANEVDNTVSLLRGDGAGGFNLYRTETIGKGPTHIVAADLNRDGRIDLAVNSPGETTPGVSLLLASSTAGQFLSYVLVPVGTVPDMLAVGDFDRDGDPDIAVCDSMGTLTPGSVKVLQNDGSGVFTQLGSIQVGIKPTAVVAADFDRDGILDLAVANDDSDNVSILLGSGTGGFTPQAPLALASPDGSPVSLAVADFDGDGAPDLAVAAAGGDRLHVYRNTGGGAFAAPDTFAAPDVLLDVAAAADLNQDGKADLAAAADGLSVFRGKGGLDFDPPESVVAGQAPWALATGDFNRDGWPDAAVVLDSNQVTIFLSSACAARRLDVSLQPATCGGGLPPYLRDVIVDVLDDGGNPAACAAGDVMPGIVPGTGDDSAVLGGPASRPVVNGTASFTGGDALTLDRPGRRYRLQFSLSGVPPAVTRSFTLGVQPSILGPGSFCPSTTATYTAEGSYDEYAWILDASPTPFAYTPLVVLQDPLAIGSHTLRLSTRVDGCADSAPPRTIWYSSWQRTTLAISGLSTVCVDCIGGTVTPTDEGGGTAQSRQWGYRTVSGGTITPIPGETSPTYILKGTDFPGPGAYYLVVTTVPTCPATPSVSLELPVIVSAAVSGNEVQFLAVTSRGAGANGENLLQWVNSTGTPEKVRIRWNKAPSGTSSCVSPLDPVAGTPSGELDIDNPPANMEGQYPFSGLEIDTAYCYSVFVRKAGVWAPGRIVKARPFDADAGPVKWAYSTGATAVVPPVVGQYGVLALSNDRTVHAVTRGSVGGVWPANWTPLSLTGVAHSRSPIVPFATPVNGHETVLFVGDDAGDVHGVDAQTGIVVWPPQPQGKPIVGAPGGMFIQYSGVRDVILVGTRDGSGPNELRGLDVSDGLSAGSPFTAGGTIGAISGTPAIDYSTQRVYFTSRSLAGGPTVWCVEVGTSPLFTPRWSRNDLADVDGSPVLRGDRVYFGTTSGVVYSLDALNGNDDRTFTTGDGPVKGFLFPDRRNKDLIFATDNKVWSISDDGSTVMPENWEWTTSGLNPSIVLYWPQTSYVYVGGANGRLWQLDFTYNPAAPQFATPLTLGDGRGQIGAPSLDIGVQPPDVAAGKKLLVVGSESGVLYGVEVPF